MSSSRERREVKMKTAQDLAEQTRGFENTAVKLPEGVEWWNVSKMEAGDRGKVVEVDFMPYIVGAGNPDCDEGWGYYRRKYLIHRIPTPKSPRGTPICCELNFGRKSCRICRWLERVANAEMAKDCKAKSRYLWIVNPQPGKEPGTKDNPWKVFESSDYNRGMGFRELMQDAINDAGDAGQEFCDLKKGMTARMTVKLQPGFGGDSKPYNAVTRISFVPRKHQYSSKLLAAAPCLDAMLIDTDAETLDELIGGGGEEAPTKTRKSRDADAHEEEQDSAVEPSDVEGSEPKDSATGSDVSSDVEDSAVEASSNGHVGKFKAGDFVTYKKREYEVLKVSGDGTSLTLEDENGKQERGVDPADCKRVPVADAGSDVEEDSAVEPSDVSSDVEDSAVEDGSDVAGSDLDEDSVVSSDVEDSAVEEPSDVEPTPKKKASSKPAAKPAAKKPTAKPAAKKPGRK